MIASADGYRGGWVVAQSAGWPCGATPDMRLCGTFLDVIAATQGCDILVVDMPIGLPDQGCRACDGLGRKELGTAGQSRVFYAPPRPALAAQDWDQFKQLHWQGNGCGLSKQVYGLCIRLIDVDRVMTPARQARIMEFHPELAWARLGGATLPSKHTAAGILARLRLLRPCVPGIDVIDTVHVEASASPGIDDLLDAVVGLCVAAAILAKLSPPYRLPVQNPPVDSKGLRMEIWY